MGQNERRTVEATLAAAGVRFAYLFGSRAVGTERDPSDGGAAATALRATEQGYLARVAERGL